MITTIAHGDVTYPALLNEIHQPPEQLYYRGDISLLKYDRLLAIVGARKATRYGRTVVEQSVRELVQEECITVSGLAYGIDGAVAKETLSNGGRTIAVLGSPVNDTEVYPAAHRGLAQRIVDAGGLLLSEFPEGTPTYPGNFPQRNRIISGLCPATLVVEAGLKSGSLITAKFAREQNREVFAVPGQITSAQSAGTNWLIEHGATPWLGIDSLFRAMPQLRPLKRVERNSMRLGGNAKKIYELLSEPQTLDALIYASGLPAHEVMQILTTLQLQEAVFESTGVYSQRA